MKLSSGPSVTPWTVKQLSDTFGRRWSHKLQMYLEWGVCVCVWICVEARGWCQVSSSVLCILSFEAGSLSEPGASGSLGLLARKSEVSYFYLSVSGFFCIWDSSSMREWNSGLDACKANTLRNKLSSYFLDLFFNVIDTALCFGNVEMRCTFFTSVKTDKSLEMYAARVERELGAAGFLPSSRGNMRVTSATPFSLCL